MKCVVLSTETASAAALIRPSSRYAFRKALWFAFRPAESFGGLLGRRRGFFLRVDFVDFFIALLDRFGATFFLPVFFFPVFFVMGGKWTLPPTVYHRGRDRLAQSVTHGVALSAHAARLISLAALRKRQEESRLSSFHTR